MTCDDAIKTTLATLIIAFSWGLAASAMAEESRADGPLWLWSETSPVSNKAATALGDGNLARGLRLTNTALARAEDKRDRLIAHHNLCIAHTVRARPQAALRHCQETRRLADGGFVVNDQHRKMAALDVLEANLDRLGYPNLGKAF